MERKFRILIVEDDESLNNALSIFLKKQEYDCVQAFDGKTAIEEFSSSHFDLIILDIMLPVMSGKEVIRELRSFTDVPIMMLTALSQEYDKLEVFELGADDYVTKPFSLKEVGARVKALLTRAYQSSDKIREYLFYENVKINPYKRLAYLDDKELELTKKEFDLLYLFVTNPNIVFTREMLIDRVWNDSEINDIRTVDTHVKQVRSRLGKYKNYIHTVWGVGYKFGK